MFHVMAELKPVLGTGLRPSMGVGIVKGLIQRPGSAILRNVQVSPEKKVTSICDS